MTSRHLLVDGLNLFTRHYVAHPAMSGNGEQVGGVVGFVNNLTRLVDRCNPSNVIVFWEGGGSKRKRDLYSDYKASRRPQKLNRYYDPDLIPVSVKNRNYQLKTIIDILNCFPITQIYVEDAEADDAIGYISKYKLRDVPKIIVSSDHDFYQLIDPLTIIWSPTLKKFVRTDFVLKKFQVHPNNFCLAKSISGDKSDNIPGVSGVGYKKLAKRFTKFSSEEDYLIDEFFSDVKLLKESKKLKMIDSILDSESLIKRNWKLVHLDVNNLSHTQVNKINEKVENPNKTCNNINAHKILKQNSITQIDLIQSNFVFKRLSGK
jgi:DNA polymerase I